MIDLSGPDVGSAIRKERKRLGVTQAELAAACELRAATLSAVENGNDARMSTLRTIRDTLTAIKAKAAKKRSKARS